MKPKECGPSHPRGLRERNERSGLPFVLEESHAWLRAIAESKLRDPVAFWKKMDTNPTPREKSGERPRSA